MPFHDNINHDYSQITILEACTVPKIISPFSNTSLTWFSTKLCSNAPVGPELPVP